MKEQIKLNGITWRIQEVTTFPAFDHDFKPIECFRLDLVEITHSHLFRPQTISVVYSNNPKPKYLKNILLKRFEPVETISKDWSTRSDSRHENDFFEVEIEALTKAGFATVTNAGFNVYYVTLTDKGRKASGLKFGWIANDPKLQETMA